MNLKGLEPGKLLFVAPFAESTDRIKSIDLTFGDSMISFSVDGKAGTVSCNGTFVDMEQYTKFYISMMALTATGGEKESFTPQGTPDISIRTVDLDGAVTEVTFTGRDEQTYNMTINGITQYYTDRSRLTRMMEKLKDCLTGQSTGS